jgi:hypothetical protein
MKRFIATLSLTLALASFSLVSPAFAGDHHRNTHVVPVPVPVPVQHHHDRVVPVPVPVPVQHHHDRVVPVPVPVAPPHNRVVPVPVPVPAPVVVNRPVRRDECIVGIYRGRHRCPEHFRYCSSFWFRGLEIVRSFFCHENYCPTEYAYDVENNQWTCPSTGAVVDCAPAACELITVICNDGGESYYYNASWLPRHRCWEWRDCRGHSHRVNCR